MATNLKLVQLQHRHEVEQLQLKQRQELETMQLSEKGRTKRVYPNGRQPIRPIVAAWLNGKKKGTKFTPTSIADQVGRASGSIASALIWIRDSDQTVALIEGKERGIHSIWEVVA